MFEKLKEQYKRAEQAIVEEKDRTELSDDGRELLESLGKEKAVEELRQRIEEIQNAQDSQNWLVRTVRKGGSGDLILRHVLAIMQRDLEILENQKRT